MNPHMREGDTRCEDSGPAFERIRDRLHREGRLTFAAFMADPFATIGAIYDCLGLDLTADTERRMRAFLAEHGQA